MAIRTYVALLRGINLGRSRRIQMADLRELIGGHGHENVRTYLQSGNIVLDSTLSARKLEQALEKQLAAGLGFEVEVLVRTGRELAAILELNPLGDIAKDPARYLVTFLRRKPPKALVEGLAVDAAGRERVIAAGRELYSWHPDGIGRSELAKRLLPKALGLSATARNWRVVEQLAGLAA